MPPTADDIEMLLDITLPERHRAALSNSADPIHEKIHLLLPEGNDVVNIFTVNSRAREQSWKEWPAQLVAFATSGCGDYFAFDTSTHPYRIYYIDPIETVPQSIRACEEEGFVFDDFDTWYHYEVSQRAV